MRISDGSSDVCSSDLQEMAEPGGPARRAQDHAALRMIGETHDGTRDGSCIEQRRRRRECRSEEHTSELQSLMRSSYAVFCLKKKKRTYDIKRHHKTQRLSTKCKEYVDNTKTET